MKYKTRETMREIRLWITGVIAPLAVIATLDNKDDIKGLFSKGKKAIKDFKTKHNF